ncbi:MAG: hypothetical protein MK074_09350 [Phycisphaerales bacterium]|nr:hypothetical protein [Phycisphaerales bacterium]
MDDTPAPDTAPKLSPPRTEPPVRAADTAVPPVLSRPPVHCRCGYDRTGLHDDAMCPECGLLDLKPPAMHRRFFLAWKREPTKVGKAAFILAVCTLAAAALTTVLTIVIAVMIFSGPRRSTMGLAFIFPFFAWVYVVLPLALPTLICSIIGACNKSTLAAASLAIALIAPVLPVIAFFVSLMFI